MNKKKRILMDGRWLSLSEWAELYGIPKKLVYQRVIVHKWSLQRALSEPVHKPSDRRGKKKPQETRGCKPTKMVEGCKYPDCFHCSLPDCLSD